MHYNEDMLDPRMWESEEDYDWEDFRQIGRLQDSVLIVLIADLLWGGLGNLQDK